MIRIPRRPFAACRPTFALLVIGLLSLTLPVLTTGCSSKGGGEAETTKKDEGKSDSEKADAGKESGKEGGEKEEATLPTVAAVTATTGSIEKTLPVTGTLMVRRDQEATLSAPVAGILDALPVRFGETVQQGQVVAQLSTKTLLGQIAQARANIAQYTVQVQQAEASALQQQGQSRSGILQAESAISNAKATLLGAQATLTGYEATLANAQQNLARNKTLLADGLVAQKDVDAAELAVRSAEAQVAAQKQTISAQEQTILSLQQAAKAASLARFQDTVKQKDVQIARQQLANAQGGLRTAEAQLALYTIHAPLTGTVTNVNASVGETVDTTTKFLTIANLDPLQLQIAIPTASAGLVRLNQPVIFTVDALPGKVFRTRIDTIGRQVDPTNNTITAIGEVSNHDRALRDDMSARVGIVLARHENVILVPRSAVFYEASTNGNTARVLKLDKDNTIHFTPVTTGFSNENNVEILSGVAGGDRLATTGGYGLPDGAKVQIEGEKSDSEKKETDNKGAADKGDKP